MDTKNSSEKTENIIQNKEYYLGLIVENWIRNECELSTENVSKDIIKLISKYSARDEYEKLLDFMILKWKIDHKQKINGLQWEETKYYSTEDHKLFFQIYFTEIKKYVYLFDRSYVDLDGNCQEMQEYKYHEGIFNVVFDENNMNKPLYILCKGKGKANHGTPGFYHPWKGEYKFYLHEIDNLKPTVLYN